MSDDGLGELERLTRGERLLLKRLRLGEDQRQAADRLGLHSKVYRALELGRSSTNKVKLPTINRVKPHERCMLYRRRANMSQGQIANKYGCSRYWLSLMELGKRPCEKLIWFWEQ